MDELDGKLEEVDGEIDGEMEEPAIEVAGGDGAAAYDVDGIVGDGVDGMVDGVDGSVTVGLDVLHATLQFKSTGRNCHNMTTKS